MYMQVWNWAGIEALPTYTPVTHMSAKVEHICVRYFTQITGYLAHGNSSEQVWRSQGEKKRLYFRKSSLQDIHSFPLWDKYIYSRYLVVKHYRHIRNIQWQIINRYEVIHVGEFRNEECEDMFYGCSCCSYWVSLTCVWPMTGLPHDMSHAL